MVSKTRGDGDGWMRRMEETAQFTGGATNYHCLECANISNISVTRAIVNVSCINTKLIRDTRKLRKQ